MKKKIYIYPAVFHAEKRGAFSVFFPDFGDAATCGNSLEEAMYMARDFLFCVIDNSKEEGTKMPKPTDIREIKPEFSSDFVTLVELNFEQYKAYLIKENKYEIRP